MTLQPLTANKGLPSDSREAVIKFWSPEAGLGSSANLQSGGSLVDKKGARFLNTRLGVVKKLTEDGVDPGEASSKRKVRVIPKYTTKHF